MGIFDFIFGNNKKEEEARLERERQEKLKREREEKARIEAEKRRKEQESSSIEPFVFKSNCHQRYESGEPKLGLQECIRTIRVEKNTNGCSGYKLSPGKGYIVKIFNDDLGKPNMSDKPMRVVRRTADVVELRGFPIEAQTPFGWQEIDMSDYGLVVYYENGQVSKCVLHMYDRDTCIEYCQKNSSITHPNSTTEQEGSTDVENYAELAINHLKRGDEEAAYRACVSCYNAFRYSPSNLKDVQNYEKVGMALTTLMSFETIDDIDIQQRITSVAFLLLSKGIKQSPNNGNMHKCRFLIMQQYREPFQYTVMSALNLGGGGLWGMTMMGFDSRDAIYKMMFCELVDCPELSNFDQSFANAERDLRNKISSGFFGNNCNTAEKAYGDGLRNINKVVDYLENKVLVEEDIDF